MKNVEKFKEIADGEFIMLSISEIYQMMVNGEITKDEGNRESTSLKGSSIANFMRRLSDAYANRMRTTTELEAKFGVAKTKQKMEKNIGINDYISACYKDGRICVINGLHRGKSIMEIASGTNMSRISSPNKFDPDIIWYNALIAGHQVLALDPKLRDSILESKIAFVKIPDDPMHKRGCNRTKNYTGAENMHTEAFDCIFTKTLGNTVLYHKNMDCPEFHAMLVFGRLACIYGANTAVATNAFSCFKDSKEAAELVIEFSDWYKQFEFIRAKRGRGHMATLNIAKFNGIVHFAAQRWINKGMPGIESFMTKDYNSPENLPTSENFITSDECIDKVDLKIAIAKEIFKELVHLTPALMAVDSVLDGQESEKNKSNTDSPKHGIEWINKREVIRPLKSVIENLGL